jgi:hypothetical protein
MHEIPKHSWAAIVFMSAVTPAPEEGSKPAIVKTTGGVTAMAFTVNPKLKQGKKTYGGSVEPVPSPEREAFQKSYSYPLVTML